MYEILMPVDSSESRGRTQAETIAEFPGAAEDVHVRLLHVFEDEDREETTSPNQIRGGNVAKKRLQDADVAVSEISRVGDPATEILAAAEDTDADHLVLGGRKRSPFGSLLFGSVTQEVVLDADRPVTITGGEK